MEAHLSGDDLILIRAVVVDTVLSRQLYHSLVCLSTRVLEVDLIHADGVADLLSQQRLRNGVGVVECVDKVCRLRLYSRDDLFVAVARAVYRDTCVKVEVSVALFVVDVHTLSRFRTKIETLVGLYHILVYQPFKFLCGKSCVFQFHGEYPPKN